MESFVSSSVCQAGDLTEEKPFNLSPPFRQILAFLSSTKMIVLPLPVERHREMSMSIINKLSLCLRNGESFIREELSKIDKSWTAACSDSLPHVVYILTSKDREGEAQFLKEKSDIIEDVMDEVVHAYHGGFNKAIQNYCNPIQQSLDMCFKLQLHYVLQVEEVFAYDAVKTTEETPMDVRTQVIEKANHLNIKVTPMDVRTYVIEFLNQLNIKFLSLLSLAAACATASVINVLPDISGSYCPPKFCSRLIF
ncbi:uncharacterized protein LOC131249583 [Magnolia sinica]|uniref:uncharacterized protein LOC131249583 n=1 Tax=Magnolia sinica TaxID=86752 RepID=UPI002657D1F0|nr:uncharacterized protein LOC131249583 [Magnolia sinica]